MSPHESGPPDTRPPTKPPTGPPPPPPPPQVAGLKPPVRQGTHSQAAVGHHDDTPDGPGPLHSGGIVRGPISVGEREGPPGFLLPVRPMPPRFLEGEHRLVGRVGPPAHVEAATRPRPPRPGNPRPHGGEPLNPAHATRPRKP